MKQKPFDFRLNIHKQLSPECVKTTVKKLIFLLFFVCLMLNIFAQNDSTFVRHYSPTEETDESWWQFPVYWTRAANVFELYDGNFGLQTLATHFPFKDAPLIFMSPIIVYNREGQYLYTYFGLDIESWVYPHYYSNYKKDGFGNYLAIESLWAYNIHKIDNDFDYIESINLQTDTGYFGGIGDLIIEDDGFVVASIFSEYKIAKYSFDFECMWITSAIYENSKHINLRKLDDNSYISMYKKGAFNSYAYFATKISSLGEIIWTKQICTAIDDFIEINNKIYGFNYSGYHDQLKVYDLGTVFETNFENEDPIEPIYTLNAYPRYTGDEPFIDNYPYRVIHTVDNCIVLAISTPTGEIFKFDSDFNLLWCCDALDNERIGNGRHPIIELENGDLLYCASIYNNYHPYKLALVRIDSNGNYVSIDDHSQEAPAKSMIKAYPNPFRKEVSLEIKDEKNNVNHLKIYNIKGQLVESMAIKGSKANWKPQNIPSGVYIMKVFNGSNLIESKSITYIK